MRGIDGGQCRIEFGGTFGHGLQLHKLLTGRHLIIFVRAVNAQNMAPTISTVNAVGHGHGMLAYLRIAKIGINAVD